MSLSPYVIDYDLLHDITGARWLQLHKLRGQYMISCICHIWIWKYSNIKYYDDIKTFGLHKQYIFYHKCDNYTHIMLSWWIFTCNFLEVQNVIGKLVIDWFIELSLLNTLCVEKVYNHYSNLCRFITALEVRIEYITVY